MKDLIDNAESVTQIFGGWPSFHDAEVHRVSLDRDSSDSPSLEVTIHTFRKTEEVTASDHYLLCDHTLITLRFSGLVLEHLGNFNHQNVLSNLELSAIDPNLHNGRRLSVQMSASYGLEAIFECVRCAVVDTRPYDVSA